MCDFLHPKKDCRYWIKGFCRKSSDKCHYVHDPKKKGGNDSNLRDQEQSMETLIDPSNNNLSFLDRSLERMITLEIHKAMNKILSMPLPNELQDVIPMPILKTQEMSLKNFQEIQPTSWNQRL